MTDQNTRPTPSSDVAELIETLRNYAKDWSYRAGNVQPVHDAIDALSRLSPPAQVEVTDEMVRIGGDILMQHGLNAPEQTIYAAFRAALTAALTATDAKPVVPAEPVAWWKRTGPRNIIRFTPPDAGDLSPWRPLYAAPPSPVEGMEDASYSADYWKRMHDEVRARLIALEHKSRLASEGKTDA